MTRILATAFLCLFATAANAAVILSNSFDGATDNSSPYSAGQILDPNVDSLGVTRPGYTLNGGFDELVAGELRTTDGSILNFTRYFGFQIEPTGGVEIDFESFTYLGNQNIVGGGSGATKFAFRSSLDSFSADIGTANLTGTTISLASSEFQNINSSIEFRLYIQSDSTGETPNTTYDLQEFAFNGIVTAVPEPSSMALLAFGGVGLAWRRRKSKMNSAR